jgi:hypothetical protein
MKSHACIPQNRIARVDSESPLRIVVLYSDEAAAAKMTEVYGSLVHELREIAQAEGMWWSMDLLKREDVFLNSLRTALRANLLFVAVNAHQELPEEVRDWLEKALTDSPAEDRLLAALLGTANPKESWQSDVDDYFKELTTNAGIEYYSLWHQTQPTMKSIEDDLAHWYSNRKLQSLARLGQIESEPHGGLNE